MPSTKVKKSKTHQWEIYTVVPIYESKKPVPSGQKGPYVVVITLSNSQTMFTNDIHPAMKDDGSSYIYLHEPGKKDPNTPVKLRIESGSGIIYWLKSNDGQVCMVETEPFIAEDFNQAVSLAYNNISPYLSQLSFLSDTPIAIQKIDSTELNTGSQRFICLPSPANAIYPFSTALTAFGERTAQLLAEYREAKNASPQPLYQLFCYFKIIDGYISIKSERAKAGKAPIRGSEVLTDELYSGKKIAWLRDKLQNEFRNEFAHFSYQGEKKQMSADNMNNIYAVFELLPSAHQAARQAIQNLLNSEPS